VETPPPQNGPDSGITGGDGSADVSRPDTDFGPNVGEKDLPCSAPGSTLTKMTFHASDGTPAAGQYVVPIGTDNPYTCWVFDSGDKDLHVTDWAPLLDNTLVVHHIVMFGPPVQGSGAPFGGQKGPVDCRDHMPLNLFEFGWAPGGKNYSFPSDVEQVIPAHTQLILQVHYNTGAALGVPQNDTSGIALCSTSEDRPKQAGVLLLGTMDLNIPAHSTGTEAVGTCPPPSWSSIGVTSIPSDFDVLGVFPHMHTHGTKIFTNQMRGGSPVDKLGDDEDWNFNNQGFHSYETPKTVKAGDMLETHCFYDNAGNNPIGWGEDTESEMCFNFLYTVPDLSKAWGDARANLCFPYK
jgi:hypothetical protein